MAGEPKSSPATLAFLTISTAPNSTVAASQLLRLVGDAFREPTLAHAADRLGGTPEDGLTAREAADAAYGARKQEMLTQFRRVKAAGKSLTSASEWVARVFVADSRDPVEVASLARKIRRWGR